LKIFLLRKKRK